MVSSALPRIVHLGRDLCGDLSQAERREWLLTNGLGAYASGTIAGTLTRRYHGLLVAPIGASGQRRLLFAKADETLVDGDHRWPLHSNRWAGGSIIPSGHSEIESFALQGRLPSWTITLGLYRLDRRIWLEPDANTVCVAWRLWKEPLLKGPPPKLQVRLLVNCRDHHGEMVSGGIAPAVKVMPGKLAVDFGDGVLLNLRACPGSMRPETTWYENFDMAAERDRGLADRDNHLCVGVATLTLEPDAWVGVSASLDGDPPSDLGASQLRRVQHEIDVLADVQARGIIQDYPDWVAQLLLAADSFVVASAHTQPDNAPAVIAGYPWFWEWGRDTLISLPGLTLVSGRLEAARAILLRFAAAVDQGLLPNTFKENSEPSDYNTADAALWFIEAWRAYIELSGDWEALAEAYPAIVAIIEHYRTGTRFGIRRDPVDGLLFCGQPDAQVTWMDAKIGDWVVTPRIGKPVEINALWYNALITMTRFAGILGHVSEPFFSLSESALRGFQRFVRPDGKGLWDVIDGVAGDDTTIRPNQILAVSLWHSPLSATDQAAVVRQCGDDLLTTFGLRSLAPSDPEFHPHYRGSPAARDEGYHQGPVWGWLLGHYALAEFRVHGDAHKALCRLDGVRDHLSDAGLGSISEIFDGEAPHHPRGAPAQAWSVACVLEAWWRLDRQRRRDEDS